MRMINLKHTVIRFFNTLLHLTLMFCVIWFLMFTPYLIIKILFDVTYDFNIRLFINLFCVIILYNLIYKKNTLKVGLGRLTFFVFLSIIFSVFYNFTIWKLIIHFTNSNELVSYSNLTYQIFLPIPILFYITAFKSKRWFKFLEILTLFLIAISVLAFYIFDL